MLDAQTKPSTNFHCIGHSLGAHVCGFFANRMQKAGRKKMKRISGLDPAGIDWTTERIGLMEVKPMDRPLPPDSRLDASDADLVDVIHTDGNFAGTMEPLGDVDFYVGRTEASLGSAQRGCGCKDNCDHAASFKIFTESVRQPIQASKVVQCSRPSLNFTLEGCKEASRGGTTMGYFYDRNEGPLGIVGVLRESTTAEMACADASNAAGEEEEEWTDWDDWEDDWGQDDSEAAAKKGGDLSPNQSGQSSATKTSRKVAKYEIRKIIQAASKPRASHGEVGQGDQEEQPGWLGSLVPRCSITITIIFIFIIVTQVHHHMYLLYLGFNGGHLALLNSPPLLLCQVFYSSDLCIFDFFLQLLSLKFLYFNFQEDLHQTKADPLHRQDHSSVLLE